MSAKAVVTDNEGTAREAVLRAMQEAAESASGKNGVPKGPKGTRGIVMLSNDVSWTSPEDKKKKKKGDEDDDEDEGSEAPSIRPDRNAWEFNLGDETFIFFETVIV